MRLTSFNRAAFILILVLSHGPVWVGAETSLKKTTAFQTYYEKILRLKPFAYWPADEGAGSILYDRSGNGNNGKIYSVPWREDFLQFDNDFYQWIEVPHHKTFDSGAFSFGGWVYHCFDQNPQNESRVGAIVMGQPLQSNGKWGAIWGDKLNTGAFLLRYFVPPKGKTAWLEVASGGEQDALGSMEAKVQLPHSSWQHVIYTYDVGNAVLYFNGQPVRQRNQVPHKPADTPLVIGGGRWGTFNV
ncbi:MAG: LamG domain-containing protein, partial [Verrucomicrobiae bacterium]|nr:LamG domain-containing protein [Verrucomicrobiae bacterium]NNJ86615.1 hypothetical protein [Akkermansiaceae bacterium]